MIKRVVEISTPAYLHLRLKQMIIEQDGKEVASIPLEDLGYLILDAPQINITRALLSACADNGVGVLFSNEKHLPSAILLPMVGNILQTRTIAVQANCSVIVKKRLWQKLIKAKIRGQIKTLKAITGNAGSLPELVEQVSSGDKGNIEAQAAQRYWQLLFGKDFRRNPDLSGRNALLNYGYAIIRAALARSAVSSGLHPSIGVHHHNQENPFVLADDLIEPLRPLVDYHVALITKEKLDDIELERPVKQELLGLLTYPVNIGKRPLPLMAAMHSYTASLARALENVEEELVIPIWEI